MMNETPAPVTLPIPYSSFRIHHSAMPGVLLSRDGAIATVSLHNPGKLNALSLAMWQGWRAIVTELAADDALRGVVVRGAGAEAFAAGADIAEFATVRN